MVLCHLGSRTELSALTAYGYLGVAIFFVLSGYVIAKLLTDAQISLPFLGRFAARRALRLDPPYWVSLGLALMLAVLAARMGLQREFPGLREVLLHLVYAQDLLGVRPISDVYWTLCLEVQFYLTLLLALWTRRAVPIVIGLGVWSLLEHVDAVSIAPRGLFVPYWFAFALGALTYWAGIGRIRLETLLIAIFVVLACSPLKHGPWCFAAALTAGALALAQHWRRMQTWLSGRLAQFGGRISYSLYLFHPTIGWSVQSLALREFEPWPAFAFGVAASLASAVLAYHVIERPAIALSRCVALEAAS